MSTDSKNPRASARGAVNKKQMLDLMRLLSALESWAMSRSERLPDYLHEQIANSTEALEGYILEGKP